MKPQIITVQEVRSYFNDLIPTLHKNDYFGFEDGARKYVKDKHTTWYVFFTLHYDKINDVQIFLIRYVSNNHLISKYM